MFEIIIMSIISIIGSLSLSSIQKISLFKDIADVGYLIDIEKMSEINKKINPKYHNIKPLLLFIPFINLISISSDIYKYFKNYDYLLSQLDYMDCVKKMPDQIWQKYRKNPSLINSFLINMDVYLKKLTLIIDEKEGKNEFTNEFSDSFNDFSNIEGFNKVLEEKKVDIPEKEEPEYIDIISEKAKIKSIKLRELADNAYLEVELVDENNKTIGIFGSPNITDPINFRRELFGILSATDCYDLLLLGKKEINPIPISFKCDTRDIVKELYNADNQVFHLNDQDKYVIEDQIIEDERETFSGEIKAISSRSGSFDIRIFTEYFMTSFMLGNLYYGFGYPLTFTSDSQKYIQEASSDYRDFIKCILKFCHTDDLLSLSGKPDNFPEVLVSKDESGNITAIGSANNEYYLQIVDDNYVIQRGKLRLEDKKIKKLI